VTEQIDRLGGIVTRSKQIKQQLVVVSAEKLLAMELKPREMLLDPILARQSLSMLYACRGIGKTHIALGLAGAIAIGSRFLTWAAPQPRRVLFVDGELPAPTLREWLAMTLTGINNMPSQETLKFVTPDLQQGPMPDLATLSGQRLLEPHLA
jgi:RecA-family ATPase